MLERPWRVNTIDTCVPSLGTLRVSGKLEADRAKPNGNLESQIESPGAPATEIRRINQQPDDIRLISINPNFVHPSVFLQPFLVWHMTNQY